MNKEYRMKLINKKRKDINGIYIDKSEKRKRNEKFRMEECIKEEIRKNLMSDKYIKLSGEFFDKKEIENIMKYNNSTTVVLYLLLCMEALKYDGKIEMTRNNIMKFYRRNERFMNKLGDRSFITIMYRLQKNKLISIDKNCIYINNWEALTK